LTQVHLVYRISQLKQALPPHSQGSSSLPSYASTRVVPLRILQHHWRHKGNKQGRQALTWWSSYLADKPLWEHLKDLRSCFSAAPA
jgi:hypothetical protein